MTRVVVTGMGAVSACGVGVDALWTAARDGRSGMRDVEFPQIARQRVKQAGAIAPETYDHIWQGANPRLQDRVSAIAVAAAREAVAQAGLEAGDFGPSCGVIVGTGYGGADTLDRNVYAFSRDPNARVDPLCIPKIMTSAPAAWVAMEFAAQGPTMCISTACSSATQSIGLGMQMIRAGMVTRCLAGGAEALIVAHVFRSWEILRILTPGLCRPFSQGRDGMNLGEGAGVLVLEDREAAIARGAPIIAELAGYGTTGGAPDLLRSDAAGAAAAIAASLRDAGLGPEEIGYVNAHGTGTVANDLAEAEAMRSVFGAALDSMAVSSTKPVHGHALGAAGALQFIIAVQAMREQVAPPTLNFEGVDPKVGLDPVSGGPRRFAGRAVMANSFAFGGVNASLVAISGD